MRILWICLLMYPMGLFAQKDTTEQQPNIKQHELALNFTFFVKQFIDFGGNTFAISPYALSYKYIAANNHSLRTGMGISFSSSSTNSDDPGTTDSKAKSISFDYRLGYEYRVKLARAWSMFAGVDVVTNIRNSKSTTSTSFQDVDLKQRNFGFGGGPVLGVQVHFNKRISLFTESTLYFSANTSKQNNSFKNNTTGIITRESSTTKGSGLSIQLPTSLYLAVRLFKK